VSINQEETDRLLRDLASASNDVKKQISGKPGEASEKRYGIAYQQCVKAGIKPPLKRKYR
jgi:hypothetical protein